MGKKSIFWALFCFLLFASCPLFATHIVGGEFELQHEQGDRYRLRLILYNDDIHGNPGAIDPYAEVFIWSKRGNSFIRTVSLDFFERRSILYNEPDCPSMPIRTSKVTYAAMISLDASFNDVSGYYITYERCCRNNIIDNIVAPEATGQTFYVEFPAASVNGEAQINSSPVFAAPPSDYLPVNQPFRFDSNAYDQDGDSLVYSLVTPLAGYSSPDAPIPVSANPAPYPVVNWQSGYGDNAMVPGDPALFVSEDGFLEITPTEEGLFVFAIRVEEYRQGRKLGEVRREYQMVVYAQNNNEPHVLSSLNNYQDVDSYHLEAVLGEPLNFNIRVTDREKNRLVISVVGDGFSLQELGMTFSANSTKGLIEGTFSWMPSCELLEPGTTAEFTIYFVGEDEDICNANGSDVLAVHINLKASPNERPTINAFVGGEPVMSLLSVVLDQEMTIQVEGVDSDVDDRLHLKLDNVITTDNQAVSYVWQDAEGRGTVRSSLSLQALCETLNGASETLLTFNFRVYDDHCSVAEDTVAVQVLVRDRPQDWDRVSYVNFFSPNGDQCNQLFEIQNLPEDACNNTFEYIRIYNRWGKLLYESNDRNFQWDGEGQPAGTYYYLLKYTGMTYRSPLTLVLGDQAGNDVLCP